MLLCRCTHLCEYIWRLEVNAGGHSQVPLHVLFCFCFKWKRKRQRKTDKKRVSVCVCIPVFTCMHMYVMAYMWKSWDFCLLPSEPSQWPLNLYYYCFERGFCYITQADLECCMWPRLSSSSWSLYVSLLSVGSTFIHHPLWHIKFNRQIQEKSLPWTGKMQIRHLAPNQWSDLRTHTVTGDNWNWRDCLAGP